MKFTDIFIERPVLATVISLMILALGIRSLLSLPIRQYPYTVNAVITVTTTYTGADPSIIAGFISTPLETSIAQANGIDYMTSTSTLSTSTISIYLKLNYDPQKALADINTKINAVLNQLPKESQTPVVTVQLGQTIDSMYIAFYSDILSANQITDYILRVVQPKIQSIDGIQQAELHGDRNFAMRIWIDPVKLAGFGLTTSDIANALANNNVITASGRTDGNMFTVTIANSTNLTTVKQFQRMVVKATPSIIVRLEDVATISLGANNYDSSVSYNGKQAVYVGTLLTPDANLIDVTKRIKNVLPEIIDNLPEGLKAKIVYDSSEFVNASEYEVVLSLVEALAIVTVVIYLFLGSIRSVVIPLVAIPLSLIGAFIIMLALHYSVNILTLLALVLGIGLVVDDAIIVVENVERHMELGTDRIRAAIIGARELANPIIAISVVLIAVYVPIGFMGGLTGALFTEFAFTLAGAVAVSAIIALTLSPMMSSKLLKKPEKKEENHFNLKEYIDKQFDRLRVNYHAFLHESLNSINVIVVFAIIILLSIYYLYSTSKSELAPQEDQGIILSQLTTAPNATLAQTQLYANAVHKIAASFPESRTIFQIDGYQGLNTSIVGMGLKTWEQRKLTSNELQPLWQQKVSQLTGALISIFQLPSLPGARGLPIQYVIQTTEPFERLNEINQEFMTKARESGMFAFLDTDLKIDKAQSKIILNRDKISELGLTMQDIGTILSGALSQNYINYFDLSGRSYQVIPQITREKRQNYDQLLNYYIVPHTGNAIPLSTVASLKQYVVPESLNHFQQLNSATLSAVTIPGITMGQALESLNAIAKQLLPAGYTVDYGGQSRQFVQESAALVSTFFFALIIIFLSLAALFESFRDPLIILISVPMSICGALIFISLGIGGASLNIFTEVGLVTLIGLISKHGILIVQFANDLQREGKSKREAIEEAASIRLRPILMTTAAMVLGVTPLITATGAGAVSRYNIGLVIGTGIAIGTLFTLFVVPAMYMLLAGQHQQNTDSIAEQVTY